MVDRHVYNTMEYRVQTEIINVAPAIATIIQTATKVAKVPVPALNAALSEALCTKVAIGAYTTPVKFSRYVGRGDVAVWGITVLVVCISASPVTVMLPYVNVTLAVVKP
jgi:hypothetical protein